MDAKAIVDGAHSLGIKNDAELVSFTLGVAKAQQSRGEKGSGIKIYGLPASSNVMAPLMLVVDADAGELATCNIMEGEHKTEKFLKINYLGQVPMMEDGDLQCGESATILRYLARRYLPSAYPADPVIGCKIDFALDTLGKVYGAHQACVYPAMNFASPSADPEKTNAAYLAAVNEWMSHHIPETGLFVAGRDSPTIADYKAIALFYAAVQPRIATVTGLKVPKALQDYVDLFLSHSKGSSLLSSAGGWSIKEYCASLQ
jgi:glutathione S-transferase